MEYLASAPEVERVRAVLADMSPLPARRALVVDESSMSLRLTCALLECAGCIVESTSSSEEALAKCAATTYDVMFVDMHLPGMSGRELIARLRRFEQIRRAPRTPVVALSADDLPPFGNLDWLDIFMSKPVTRELLVASLDILAARPEERLLYELERSLLAA